MSNVSRRHRWRALLWRWHRRIGLCVAVLVVFLSVTGILLNHTSALQLAQQPVRSLSLLNFYGVDVPKTRSFSVAGHWFSGDQNHNLYYNGYKLGSCQENLAGVLLVGDVFMVACDQELLFLDKEGNVVERLNHLYGLPVPIEQLGLCGESACLQVAGETLVVDVEQLRWPAYSAGEVSWSQAAELPEEIRQRVVHEQLGSSLSWERVVQDLHSGRFFGRWGVWLFDAAALLFLFLSLSGFWIWLASHRRRR
ncbi:hypothetical protein G8770_08230 [Aestuariicella hydrocarbonica]|uniref:PepSY domain-containing protein n=1 Tax=Pseudomaricurvus hydrocarbonicus TaxID=1470433 RepID=A0A9E5JRS0_9GAMM|nr:hypothetical protein [Aestuariicella hydrocarbonica]